jgi:colanic acid/amylovoran biosynthesis glycosyltransferase
MHKPSITHFVRKSSQLKASFIQNQILNHKDYTPNVIYKVKTELGGGYAKFSFGGIQVLDLSVGESIYSKVKFRIFKLVSLTDRFRMRKTLENTDVLHFHFGTDAGIYLPLLKSINKPKIVSFYGYDCSSFPKRFLGLGKMYLKYRVFKYADVILAMSEDMKADLIKIGCAEAKIKIHYHGIPLTKFYRVRSYEYSAITTFLIVSGLTPKKGHLVLLNAFKAAYFFNGNIRLSIVGSGPLSGEIDKFITENKMNAYVSTFPKTEYASEEHLSYFDMADVFIHPSLTSGNGDKEGIPGAIVEAMATGLPVISTHHAGIPQIIKNGLNGILVPENHAGSLSRAILEMAGNPKQREDIGKNGQLLAMSHLDLIQKEAELERIYDHFRSHKDL